MAKTSPKLQSILTSLWNLKQDQYEILPHALKVHSSTNTYSDPRLGTSFIHEAKGAMRLMNNMVASTPSTEWILQLGNAGLPMAPLPPRVVWTVEHSDVANDPEVNVICPSNTVLPFHTGSFYTILVFPGWLETSPHPHVASELIRVLAPGGRLVCWGHPGPMMTITPRGWKYLFESVSEEVEVHGVECFEELNPFYSLRSYLREWVSSLASREAAQHLLSQTVKDLIQTPLEEVMNWPSISEMERSKMNALSDTPAVFISKSKKESGKKAQEEKVEVEAPKPLVIEKAAYGEGPVMVDVTLILQARIASQNPMHLFLKAGEPVNLWFGDPRPNVPKVLSIHWRRGEQTGICVTPEYSGTLKYPVFL